MTRPTCELCDGKGWYVVSGGGMGLAEIIDCPNCPAPAKPQEPEGNAELDAKFLDAFATQGDNYGFGSIIRLRLEGTAQLLRDLDARIRELEKKCDS
jgi:hypothetical protein